MRKFAINDKKEDLLLFVKCIIALVSPILTCFIYLASKGHSFSDIYIPSSYNNDCLFYYNQVAGILDGGPFGYWGFNESHASVGGLAAWSPCIYIPWVIWGKLFGWTYISPIICNIVLFGLAFAVFVFVVKPDYLSLFACILLLCLYPSFGIHVLNVLPEAVLGSFFILLLGISIKGFENLEEGRKVVGYGIGVTVLVVFMTLIRPYMFMLMAIPASMFAIYEKKRKKTKYGMICVIGIFLCLVLISLIGYYTLSKVFTADYFEPLFNTDILKLLFAGKFRESTSLAFYTAMRVLKGIEDFVKGTISYGSTAGTQYFLALLGMVYAIIFFVLDKRKRRYVYLIYAITVLTLFFAILIFLQKANEGARHLWIFSMAACFLGMEKKRTAKALIHKGITIALLILFAVRGSFSPTDYDAPVFNEELKAQIEYWESTFEEKNIKASKEISYDNTLAWVLTDNVGGEGVVTDYDELFSIPEGMGISCCNQMYVINNFNSMKCKYIASVSGGDIDKLCKEAGFSEVGRTSKLVIYQR